MSRGYNKHLRKQLNLCSKHGKLSHVDFYSAVIHLKDLAKTNRESVDDLHAYKCAHCGHWHVGHKLGKKKI